MYVCMYNKHINKSNSQKKIFFFIDFLFLSNFLLRLLEIQDEGSIVRFSFVRRRMKYGRIWFHRIILVGR